MIDLVKRRYDDRCVNMKNGNPICARISPFLGVGLFRKKTNYSAHVYPYPRPIVFSNFSSSKSRSSTIDFNNIAQFALRSSI